MKNIKILYAGIVAILIIALLITRNYYSNQPEFATVTKKNLAFSVSGEATIMAEKSQSIFSQTEGIIAAIQKQNGDKISINEVILILRNEKVGSEYQKLLLEKNILETKINNSNYGNSTNLERLKVAREDLLKVENDYAQAKDSLALGAVSLKAVKEYETIVKKNNIYILDLKNNIKQTELELKTLSYNLKEINRQIEMSKQQGESLSVVSNMQGELVNIPSAIKVGALLQNNTFIGEVIGEKRNTKVCIDNNLSEKVKVGDSISYYYQNNIITGNIEQKLAPFYNIESRKTEITLICSISQPLPYLINLPAKIWYEQKNGINTLPLDFINSDNDTYYVWIKSHGQLSKKYIKIIDISGDSAQIDLPEGTNVYKN